MSAIQTAGSKQRQAIEVDEEGQVSGQTTPSKDKDARWTKKNGLYRLGYKQHTRTDEEGYIEKLHITPANTHECNHLSPLLEGIAEDTTVYADKGYDSAENRQHLEEHQLLDGIMRKAHRNRPLTENQTKRNRYLSKTRYVVEQSFGTLHRKFRYRTWLGSDYMLKALQTDPNRTHKRLGDGYYEQRLINEQIARLTGYRRLDGYPNDEAQFQALMDAGISFARTQQLTPGIALSPEQVARLTSDIVWLESQTVTLADGSSQSVLVPKVYVLARPGDLNSAGGLISADALQLNAGRIDNRGTLAGRRIVDLAAGDISNSGRIGGKNVILDAQQQIDITGGSIEAERLLSLKADNITLQSSTAQSGDSHNGRTTVDRVAGLYVSGTEDGQGLLSLEAGHDIKLNGARLANRARDGRTQVVSRQGSVTLGTVRTESPCKTHRR